MSPHVRKMETTLDRCQVLLQAAIDIIKNAEGDAGLEATATWDNAECDGLCLIDECEVMIQDIVALRSKKATS